MEESWRAANGKGARDGEERSGACKGKLYYPLVLVYRSFLFAILPLAIFPQEAYKGVENSFKSTVASR